MRRREFITVLGSAAMWSLAARAQQGERVRRIGLLMPYPPTNAEMQAHVRAFREELRKRGWAASVNAQFDERWTSDNMDLIRSAATNLVELNPDVILAVGARVVPILMELTRSIPIVTPSGSVAIERGYAGSVDSSGGAAQWRHFCPFRRNYQRLHGADHRNDCAASVAGDLFRARLRDERRAGFLRYGSR
jgi:putative ABC transport system substrate-binding protein